MTFTNKKAQTATEYLIILAVVIVIALTITQLLGGFSSIGGGVSKNANSLILRNEKIGVENYYVNSTFAKLKVRNNNPFSVSITNITIDESSCLLSSFNLKIGESKLVNCTDFFTDYSDGKRIPNIKVTWIDLSNSAIYKTKGLGITSASSSGLSENCTNSIDDDSDSLIDCDDSDCSSNSNCIIESLRVGLVGYWPLDEISGSTASDFSDTNNDGTISGATLNQAGKVGTAFNFDGSNDYISLNINDLPTGQSNRTVCYWANANSVSSNYAWVLGYGDASNNNMFTLGRYSNTARVAAWGSAGMASDNITAGNWYFMCTTFNGSQLEIYMDGVSSYSGAKSWNTGTEWAYIGRMTNGEYWDGLIDEVAVWDRILNISEILDLYNSGNGLSLKP